MGTNRKAPFETPQTRASGEKNSPSGMLWGRASPERTLQGPRTLLQRGVSSNSQEEAPQPKSKNFSDIEKSESKFASFSTCLIFRVDALNPFKYLILKANWKQKSGSFPRHSERLPGYRATTAPPCPRSEEVGRLPEVCGQGHRKSEKNEIFLVWLLSSKLVLFFSSFLAKFCIFRVLVAQVSLPCWFYCLIKQRVLSNDYPEHPHR